MQRMKTWHEIIILEILALEEMRGEYAAHFGGNFLRSKKGFSFWGVLLENRHPLVFQLYLTCISLISNKRMIIEWY